MPVKSLFIRLVLTAMMVGVASSASAAMYKWTDKNGKVHYTETPPPQGNVTEIAPPPRVASPSAGESAKEKSADGKKGEKKGGDAPLSPEEAEIYKQNCETAKANLDLYQTSESIKQAEDGKVVPMDDEMRIRKSQEANDLIKKFCK